MKDLEDEAGEAEGPGPRRSDGDGWRLDRHIPVALIVLLLTQTFGVAWWASRSDFRLEDHDRRLTLLERSDAAQSTIFGQISERLARIEERLLVLLEQRADTRRAP